ncbi:MAG TPA: zinc ribbon domain-containing protein [Dictyobacter sp.]|jgi:hypothetical protein|nr:zinc ribbon domain-containing protein [Dictyobacter sp.]
MSDFFESAKNFVNSAVSRTSWEAQKQMRVRGKQGEIDTLVEQRRKLVDELGQTAMNLYQQGALTDSHLSRLCASIFELDHDLRNRETQLQQVKGETYPADQFAPGPTMNYAPPTSSSSTPSPQNPVHPVGGQIPNYNAGNSAAGSQPSTRCPQCGNAVRPGSLYCRNCGAKVS